MFYALTNHRAAVTGCFMLGLLLAAGAEAGEQLTVQLQSGRTFTARVDARTDDERLWLRFEDGAMTLWRPVRWERVVEGVYRGQPLTPDEVRAAAERIKSKPSAVEEVAPAESYGGEDSLSQTSGAVTLNGRKSGDFHDGNFSAGDDPARSLRLAARVANWDADVEADGLLLYAAALDGRGREVPVAGHLTIELIGFRPAARLDQFVRVHGEPFPTLGRWTRRIDTRHAEPGGACLQLPFQNAHPDFDADFAAHGVVHARLVAPGRGVFEASADLTRIRPFSPLRDQLQQTEGRRFFAEERVGRRD
jgi:hypothetical protein